MNVRPTYRAAMCEGKPGYGSYDSAKKAARRGEVHPYHCKVCGRYHVGGIDRDRKLANRRIRQRKAEA